MNLRVYYDQYCQQMQTAFQRYTPSLHVQCTVSKHIQHWQNGIAIQPHPAFVNAGLHYHDFFELIYVHCGTCINLIDGLAVAMKEGDLCLLNTNAVHNIQCCDPDQTVIFNILVLPSVLETAHFKLLSFNNFVSDFFLDGLQKKKAKDNYILFHSTSKQDGYEPICVQMITEYYEHQQALYHISKIIFLFDCLLIDLVRSYQQQYDVLLQSRKTTYYFSDVISYMEEHCNTITLQALSDHFGYHPKYLSRLMQQATGYSYSKLLLHLRLNRAKELLEHTPLPITEVVHQVGYRNNTWFFARFQEAFGMTPSQYRLHHSDQQSP